MKDFWEDRFSESGYAYGTEPNGFLVSQKKRLEARQAVLSVADGEGRNGVWLAEQGLDVTTVDYSPMGVNKAEKLASVKGVHINTLCEDLTQWAWPVAEYDVVVAIFIHFPPNLRRHMHHNMMRALKSGGILIMETYHKDQLKYKTGGPPVDELLYTETQLREDFGDYEILFFEHAVTRIEEGKYHQGKSSVLCLVVRRPG